MNTGEHIVPSRAGLSDDGGVSLRQRAGRLRAGGVRRDHRRAGAVAARQPENHRPQPEIEALARAVEDNGGIYFVPAFSGLYAPHWNARARGAMLGLTRYATRAHFARAALEATAFQTREVLEAMERDAGMPVHELRVDGGMVSNELLMQFQADLLDRTVVRPAVTETTALGAAYAAGLAVGYWESRRAQAPVERGATVEAGDGRSERERLYGDWQKAVGRTLDSLDG